MTTIPIEFLFVYPHGCSDGVSTASNQNTLPLFSHQFDENIDTSSTCVTSGYVCLLISKFR